MLMPVIMMDANALFTAAALLKAARHGVAFTGAGISTPSGIPDFRSPASGLWENVDPIAVASLMGFRQNPQRFYDWVRPLVQTTLNAQPNPAHLALAHLEAIGRLQGVITQNIDLLHERAGSRTVYEVHGHLREATCLACYRVYPNGPLMHQLLQDARAPQCPHCHGILKPNVILFGEQLPHKDWMGAREAARRCDLMLVVGSSLEVEPVASLPRLAKQNGAKLIIVNLHPTDQDALADVVIHADAAVVLPAIIDCLEQSP